LLYPPRIPSHYLPSSWLFGCTHVLPSCSGTHLPTHTWEPASHRGVPHILGPFGTAHHMLCSHLFLPPHIPLYPILPCRHLTFSRPPPHAALRTHPRPFLCCLTAHTARLSAIHRLISCRNSCLQRFRLLRHNIHHNDISRGYGWLACRSTAGYHPTAMWSVPNLRVLFRTFTAFVSLYVQPTLNTSLLVCCARFCLDGSLRILP